MAMMSSGSSVSSALTDYAAGRVTAEQLVGVVAAAYYGARDSGLGTRLKPLMEIIERAHPGVVELSGSVENPGFGVRLAERPFPKRYEGELREAVQIVVGAQHAAPLHDPPASLHNPPISAVPSRGIWSRIIRAVGRLFTAST